VCEHTISDQLNDPAGDHAGFAVHTGRARAGSTESQRAQLDSSEALTMKRRPRRVLERCEIDRNQSSDVVVTRDRRVAEAFHERHGDAGAHRSHEVQPVGRQARRENRHLDDQPPFALEPGNGFDHPDT